MIISKSLCNAFYNVLNDMKDVDFQDYSFSLKKRKKKVVLTRGSKLLSTWSLETGDFIDTEIKITKEDRIFIKKFKALPALVEEMHEQKKVNEISSDNDQCKTELYEGLKCLKDNEINFIEIRDLAHNIAGKYVDKWYDIGIHPDKYNDNFPIYFGFALSTVWGEITDFKDERLEKALREKMSIKPLKAQREGNLVTISDIEHKRFEKSVEMALEYVIKKVMISPFKCLPSREFEVIWWEKEKVREFSIPLVTERVNKPISLREKVLNELLPKHKKVPRPSRLLVKISFDNAQDTTFSRYKVQNGIIEWSYRK